MGWRRGCVCAGEQASSWGQDGADVLVCQSRCPWVWTGGLSGDSGSGAEPPQDPPCPAHCTPLGGWVEKERHQ